MGALYFIATLYTNFNISGEPFITFMLTMEIKQLQRYLDT